MCRSAAHRCAPSLCRSLCRAKRWVSSTQTIRAATGRTRPANARPAIKYCEAMQQHAVALLMRLTNELKTMAELRAYAGSLLNEIQQMYLADVQAEKTAAELRRRLQANVEYARSIFATRVALECPDAARLIEDEIAAALQREDSGAFGRDLKAATGQMERDRAEAS